MAAKMAAVTLKLAHLLKNLIQQCKVKGKNGSWLPDYKSVTTNKNQNTHCGCIFQQYVKLLPELRHCVADDADVEQRHLLATGEGHESVLLGEVIARVRPYFPRHVDRPNRPALPDDLSKHKDNDIECECYHQGALLLIMSIIIILIFICKAPYIQKTFLFRGAYVQRL